MPHHRYAFSPLFALAFVLVGTSGFKSETRPDQRNAILISWDGALREHVRSEKAAEND